MTREEKKTGRELDGYRRIAPDVEGAWVEAFVLEQRLIGVPGRAIGDGLAVVQSHVAESGEEARDAFGDPVAYARESAPSERVGELSAGWFVASGLGLVGMLLAVRSFGDLLAGEPVQVTAGLLVLLTLAGAGLVGLAVAGDRVLSLVVRRPVTATLLFVLHFALMVGALLLLPATVLTVPAAAALAVGLVLLVVGSALEARSVGRGELEDPITGPDQAQPATRRPSRSSWLLVLLFPLLTAAMLLLQWVVHALA